MIKLKLIGDRSPQYQAGGLFSYSVLGKVLDLQRKLDSSPTLFERSRRLLDHCPMAENSINSAFIIHPCFGKLET